MEVLLGLETQLIRTIIYTHYILLTQIQVLLVVRRENQPLCKKDNHVISSQWWRVLVNWFKPQYCLVNGYNVTNVKIQYSTDGGSSWNSIIASYPASSGIYDWQVPNTVSNNCKVKILDASDSNISDISDNYFSITPSLTIISPNGGEQWIEVR